MRRAQPEVRALMFEKVAGACLVLVVITGCGGGPVDALDKSTDTGAINLAMSKLVDAATSKSLAEEIFTKEAVPKPAELAKFGKYAGYVLKDAQIDGDNAKLKVEVYSMAGQLVATQDWTATKAGGAWRIQSAPLPK